MVSGETIPLHTSDEISFMGGGGEMGALMRNHDWSSTPIGPPQNWPVPLRTAVQLMLNTNHPMYIFWGEHSICMYNDAYRPSIGSERHPGSLGQPGREVWAEIWDVIGPQIDQVMAGKGATWHENQLIPTTRNGKFEDIYWTYSYSPIGDKNSANGVGGVLVLCHETTQSVLTTAALSESENRFQQIANSAPVPMWVTQLDRTRSFVNAAYLDFLKVDYDAALKFDWRSILHPDDHDRIVAESIAGEASLQPFVLEARYKGGDGVWRWLRSESQPRWGPDGAHIGFIGVAHDVTEARETEAILRESEHRFREQFENANDFIFTTDLEMRVISCNPAVARALERTPDELIGHRISDFTPPETWEHNKAMLAAKLAGKGDATRYEVEVFNRQGERMTWEINSRLIRDPDGQPSGLHAIGRDVTEQSRNQRLLDAARVRAETDAAQQAAILGQLAEGVIVTDADGRITFVNDAATHLHGVAKLDVEPSDYSDTYRLFREDGSVYPSEELPLARAVLQRETIRDARWRIHRPDGSEVVAIGNAQPVHGPDGETIGAVLTIRDDTARNAAEQALRELNETLEERVAMRTAELEQAQEALRQSQKLEAMGQLTGGVAHDFNNLLTPIMGSLDLLHRRGIGDEREQRLIEGALQSAERAKLLVQRLLAFARRQPLKTVAVDIRQLIYGMADLVASTCGPGIKVSVAVDDDVAPAIADPNQLEMAILNLSVNARDAMPDGGRLTLSATSEKLAKGENTRLAPGRYVRISVADTGCGMDEATAQRAIEPFFSTKGVGKGTGLGLSMAHGLASQLGGMLTISSAVGVGTNVELWLPASDEEIEAETPGPDSFPIETRAGTVLLVDDEMLVRASTADMLVELGYDVVEAATGEEALRIFDAGRPFDMLVTDYLMPGMNGVDLAHAVLDRQPQLPILVVSGYAETGGVPAYLPRLTKPFRQADLAEVIAEIVKDDNPVT
jgi:PAS domain S-box-containing protein